MMTVTTRGSLFIKTLKKRIFIKKKKKKKKN